MKVVDEKFESCFSFRIEAHGRNSKFLIDDTKIEFNQCKRFETSSDEKFER